MSPPFTPKRPLFITGFTTALSAVLLWCTATASMAQAPLVDGEVIRINTAAQKITLKHGEIPNLDMPPMTMVFGVQQQGDLAALQPGDRVRFSADKVGGQYTVTTLQAVTAGAPATSTAPPVAPTGGASATTGEPANSSGTAAAHRH